MRLIDAESLKELFPDNGEGSWTYNATAKAYIDAQPTVQPDTIRCKDCVYQTESWSGIKYCEAHGDHIGKDYDYCSNARRKENGQTDFTASCD